MCQRSGWLPSRILHAACLVDCRGIKKKELEGGGESKKRKGGCMEADLRLGYRGNPIEIRKLKKSQRV